MSCRCSPALMTLRKQLDAAYPHRSRASDGCCASQLHHQQNPKSDHDPNAAGIATAHDFTHDPNHGVNGDVLASLLMLDPRVKYLIWSRRIWFPRARAGGRPAGWSAYTGPNPHTKHVHLSIVASAVRDTSPWPLAGTPSAAPIPPLQPPPAPRRRHREVEMLVYRQNNTGAVKLYRGPGVTEILPNPAARDRWLTYLDQRPDGTHLAEWVLPAEDVAILERPAP